MLQPFLRARPLAHPAALWAIRQQPLISIGLRSFAATQGPDANLSKKERIKRRREAKAQSKAKAKAKGSYLHKPKREKPSKDTPSGAAESGESGIAGKLAPDHGSEEAQKNAGDFHAAGAPPSAGTWTSLKSRLQSPALKRRARKAEEDGTEEEGVDVVKRDAERPVASARSADEKTSLDGRLGKGKRTKIKRGLNVKTIRPQHLQLCPVEEDSLVPVPQLCHDLNRVLFNPGVYHMQDVRSRVYNFDPYLASIMPVKEFDFDALRRYVTSSKDVKLRQLSASHGMKYCGSTSSMTSILSHFHYLLSAWRRPNFAFLSRSIEPESYNFTALSRGPAAAFAHYKDGTYAFDSDKEYDTENILSLLGKSMEKLLTLPKDEFEKYRRTKSHSLSEEERNAQDSFHYTTLGDFMMRSQLDAYDPRLPGSGMFDLKTRAVVSVRMDVRGYEKGAGYEIRKRFGQWESFEREYYDMIRTVFLKYSLQVRMGRMDGIFVAYHNTQRIFGFQYISLEEMDVALHGTSDRRLGDQEFKTSVALLNELMDRATKKYPGRTLRLHVETRPTKVPLTYFFVEPVTEEEMTITQEAGKSSVEELERELLTLSETENEEDPEGADSTAQVEPEQVDGEAKQLPNEASHKGTPNEAAWNVMMLKVEETVEDESLGIGSVREAVQEALEQSGLLNNKTELEIEQSLDAMVASLTAHSSKIKELRDRSDEPGQTTKPAAKRDAEDDDVSEEEEPADDKQSFEHGATGGESEAENASLADLILRATEGIDNQARNLKTFQRMFADLAVESKQPDTSSSEMRGKTPAADEELNEDELADEDEDDGDVEEPGQKDRELLGMYVTIRNQVNGEYVERPNINQEGDFDWSVEYTITELPDKRARKIYSKIKQRRRKVLAPQSSDGWDWYKMFQGKLPALAKKGQQFRELRTQQEANEPVHVAWEPTALPPDAFKPASGDGEEDK
ncbi:PET127-like protein [Trichoderma longibrachiatum]|uniref:Pet127-domain-containing protein n=1 Tax=Trichoderma longibrachiatum ATCC 18648 TaxID=983965 RepID=A0A2T4CAL3_TRILO|nr:Pet127-domain-containing protein [Trichoderma longibrachiatum ATCC 18648]